MEGGVDANMMGSPATLEQLYAAFGKGKELDSRSFLKLCKDTKLVGGGLTPTDCDLIFAKSKKKGAARLTFSDFQVAMEDVSRKKNMTMEELLERVAKCEGPEFRGTATQPVRFYDDKSTYTGVHANGGPSTVDRKAKGTFSEYAPNQPTGTTKITLADMCDRSTPNVRGVNKDLMR